MIFLSILVLVACDNAYCYCYHSNLLRRTMLAYTGIALWLFNYYYEFMIHSILHKQTPINPTSHFQFNALDTHSHSLILQTLYSTINAFRYSFYVNAPFVWNQILYDVLSLPPKSFSLKPCLHLFS